MLERRFGRLSERAAELARELLGPAVEATDPFGIEQALVEIERRLAAEFPDDFFDRESRDVASKVDRRHGVAFFAALALAAGVTIVGSDRRPEIPFTARPRGGRRRAVLGVKLSANPAILADKFAAENAARIKSLRSEIIPALRDEVVRAQAGFVTPEQAAERLARKWAEKGVPVGDGNLRPRVAQIVHNQVSALNTDIARSRAEASGLTEFIWRTQRDSRVRPVHRAAEGRRFSFESGHPTEGLPGQPAGCRCHPEPVVDAAAVVNGPGFVQLAGAEVGLAV